ncbi:MAG: ATP-binding protein [Planctomycetota bacterium]
MSHDDDANPVTPPAAPLHASAPLVAAADRLLAASLDAVLLLDPEGVVSYANPSAEQLFGRPADSLLGASLGIPIDGGDLSRLTLRRPDGSSREAELRVVDLGDKSTQTIFVTLRDVTDKLELEQRLAGAEKMEAVGRLAGGVAHDFNNLLTAVIGYARLAERRVDKAEGFVDGQSDSLKGDLAEVRRAAETAQELTRSLLSFSGRHRPPSGRSDLNQLLVEHRRMYEAACGGKIRLEIDADNTPPVNAEPDQVDRILLNLLVNAHDATVGNGPSEEPIRIVLRHHADQGDYGWAELQIIDHGTGIPGSARPHVFEPFFTTKPEGLGTGLGLSTVYGLVRRSGGRVEFSDTPGGGTTFIIRLPCVDADATTDQTPTSDETSEALEALVHASENRALRVLLVEDQDAVRKLLMRILRRAHFDVDAAADGTQAIELLEEAAEGHRLPYDVIASDVAMPGLTGVDVAKRAGELFPDLPVLLMSGYTNGEVAASASPHFANTSMPWRFLQKPFEPDVLVRELVVALK